MQIHVKITTKTQRNKSTKTRMVVFEVFRCPATTFTLLIEIISSSRSRKSCQRSSIYKRFIAELTFLGISFFLPLSQTHTQQLLICVKNSCRNSLLNLYFEPGSGGECL